MENVYKLKATKDFIDLKGKRDIPQGVTFTEVDKERALRFVEAGVADILERPKTQDVEKTDDTEKSDSTKQDKPKVVEAVKVAPKQVEKPKKPAAKPVKKVTKTIKK